jgi:hypothetical protein
MKINVILLFFILGFANAAYANDNISVTINGTSIDFPDQTPVVINGHTFVPVRGVFEELGFDMAWNGSNGQVTLTRDGYVIVITIGNAIFTVNGDKHRLDAPAQIINGRTMLPIRAVAESAGYAVRWASAANTVEIYTSPIAVSLLEFFSGGVEGLRSPFYPAFDTLAILVDLDGLGTPGVVAVRHEYECNPSLSFSITKIFYFYNDTLNYKYLGSLEGFPFALGVTSERRPFLVGGDAGYNHYTIFGFDDGRLVYDFAIIRAMNQCPTYHHHYYYYLFIPGGIFNVNTSEEGLSITEYQFNEIRLQYGLDNLLPWVKMDETESILAVTAYQFSGK